MQAIVRHILFAALALTSSSSGVASAEAVTPLSATAPTAHVDASAIPENTPITDAAEMMQSAADVEQSKRDNPRPLPFRLHDHTGAPFDREALSGHFTLLYFGYTHCTDVCPIGLSVMASVLREMPAYAGQVEGAFITVDPARDSVETLQKYVGYFHPTICGVRGTVEETARAADYFEIVFRHGEQNGKPTVEHSDTIILLDENGIEQKRFPGSTRPSIIRSELTAMLAQSHNTHQKR